MRAVAIVRREKDKAKYACGITFDDIDGIYQRCRKRRDTKILQALRKIELSKRPANVYKELAALFKEVEL